MTKPKPKVTQSLREIIEPDWRYLIPDQVNFAHPEAGNAANVQKVSNTQARKFAAKQWNQILESLRENHTLTLDSLELATRLVICRVRVQMASQILFQQGLELYDIDLQRQRESYASKLVNDALRMCLMLEEHLGLTPKGRKKVAREQPKPRPDRASATYLRPVESD